MIDLIKIGEELRDEYLNYLDTGIKLKYESARQERRKLFEEPGIILQPPYVELSNKYIGTKTLKETCIDLGLDSRFADFLNKGLFYSSEDKKERKLFPHQIESLKEAIVNKKNVVITTGAGSGKTECFSLPLLYRLVEELKAYPSEDRPRAMRCMILYPLNALAEDQMVRLRKTLDDELPDGSGPKKWLQTNCNGNIIYFGRYTGKTPPKWENRED